MADDADGLVVVILCDLEVDGRAYARGEIAAGLSPDQTRDLIARGDALPAHNAAETLRGLVSRLRAHPDDYPAVALTCREWRIIANMIEDPGPVWRTLEGGSDG